MQVDVQVERRAKALDERDDAGLGTDTSAKPRTTLHRRGQRSRHHSEHAGEQVRACREEQAQRPRERQHPLAHGHAGEHVLDQPGRGLHHAPRAARRAETPALAAERHQALVAAARALPPTI